MLPSAGSETQSALGVNLASLRQYVLIATALTTLVGLVLNVSVTHATAQNVFDTKLARPRFSLLSRS